MEVRDALKKVVHFAEWEYKEKRPKSVKVLRVKSKSVFTVGVLPELQMRTIGPVIYIVISDHGDTLMIYFFNRNGERIGGQNYEPTTKFRKKLDKSTTLKYQLPKKERKEMVDDTLLAQKEFTKIHHNISKILGIYHKYHYTILVKKELQVKHSRMLGCKRVRRELHIPVELINKSYSEVLATIEWFYSYLTSSINFSEKKNNKNILYDLAILFSFAFNLNFKDKIGALKLNSFDITIQGNKYGLIKNLEQSLSSLSQEKSQKRLLFLLKNLCTILQFLNRYRISLSLLEIVQVYLLLCEIFNVSSDAYAFFTKEKYNRCLNYFYFQLFSRTHDASKELGMERLEFKSFLLSYLFGLYILTPAESNKSPYTLAEVIENVGRLIKDPNVYEGILKLTEVISDKISEYILRYLKFNTIFNLEDEVLELSLEIENLSNYVLQNFEYELLWKPKNRVQLVSKEREQKGSDLHENLETNYLLTINSKGSIVLYCRISFTNPLFQDEILEKKVLLQKLKLLEFH
ncbi:MAG: hypothetical protein ACFFEY_07230 [Candidatus Thorarchaeota archaeon]